MARAKNSSSKLGLFLEYFIDVPGSTMFGLFGLCTAIAVYRQTNNWSVFCIFMLIPMGAAIKESFRKAFITEEKKEQSSAGPAKWLGIMKDKTVKEKVIIIIRLFIIWQNQLVLWAALLYYPINRYLHFNPMFWAMVVISFVSQLQWIRTFYIEYKKAYDG